MNFLPMTVVAVLYVVNRFFLAPGATGPLKRILSWYGADFLAGALMLCLLNALLAAARRQPLRRVWPATVFLLGCGVFWECVTPLYLARSISDPWDVLAVWLGGMGMLVIEKLKPPGKL